MAITKIGTPELFDFSATNTALQLPTGDTASRPTSPSTGEWRFNSELKYVEYYDGADWFQIDTEADTPVGSENFNVNTYFGNGATQVIDAKFNEAANFNGSSSYITTGVDFQTLFAGGDYTVSMWVNKNTDTTAFFAGTINSSATNGMYLGWVDSSNSNPNSIRFIERNSSTSATSIISTASYTFGQWLNIVVVRDGNTSFLYVNGTAQGSATNASITHATDFTFGRAGAYNSLLFQGKIDQVRIYNTALDQAAVTALQLETTTTASSLSFPSGETAIATYQLDGNGDDISTNYNATSTTDIGYTGLKFQPDLVWIKSRNAVGSHIATDSVRGNGKEIYPDLTNAQGTVNRISLTSTGFDVVSAGYPNQTNNTFVAWNWKAGGSSNTFNKNGTGYGTASAAGLTGESNITIQGSSVNTESGISIIKTLTGPSTGMIIPHGLGTQPELIISKPLNAALGWYTWTPILDNGSTSSNTGWKGLFLDTAAMASPSVYVYASNTHIYDSWAVGRLMVYYSFRSIAGYSKIGSYTGDGNATGPIETTGFEPSWVMIKSSSSAEPWVIFDSVRNTSNPRTCHLRANSDIAESCLASESVDFNATNFQIKSSWAALNTIGGTYIYMAFAADPT